LQKGRVEVYDHKGIFFIEPGGSIQEIDILRIYNNNHHRHTLTISDNSGVVSLGNGDLLRVQEGIYDAGTIKAIASGARIEAAGSIQINIELLHSEVTTTVVIASDLRGDIVLNGGTVVLENTLQFADDFKRMNVDLLRAAKRRLKLWDISSEQICDLKEHQKPMRTLVFHAPSDGIVLHKNAFEGMNVRPGMNTFTIADLSHVWVLVDVYELDLASIKLCQKAELTIPSHPKYIFDGEVTFIDYVVDASTRTTKVRLEFDNTDFLLKPGMYATVTMKVAMGTVLALPDEAVIDTGKRKIVFVEAGKGRFEPREVELGFKAGSFYEVLSGVDEGENVVTSAQFLFDSESRLKALGGGEMKGHGHGA